MATEYIGGWTSQHVQKALSKLAPTCENCYGKCTYLCIEQCCVGSDLFCIDCDQQHWLHRKNQSKVLFINRRYVKSRSATLTDGLKTLSEFFHKQRELNERVIQFYQRLHELYVNAINEVESARQRFAQEESGNEQVLEMVKRVLEEKWVAPEDREEFGRYIRSLNLYEDPFCKLNSVANLSSVLGSEIGSVEMNQSKICKVLQKIREVSDQCRNCLETFVLRSNIENYQMFPNSSTFGFDFNAIERSVELVNDSRTVATIKTLKAHRAIILRENGSNSPFPAQIHTHISQLHTDSPLQSIPASIQSLSYLNLFYPSLSKAFNMKILPVGLKTLRLAMNSEPRSRVPYHLDHLVNLQTLHIVDGGMSPQETKYIRTFAIRQKLRMLTILNTQMRPGCREIRSFWCKIETCYTHKEDKLKRHYLINKRKMLQCAFLQRKLAIRNSAACVQGVLDASMSFMEAEVEREVMSGTLNSIF